MRHLTYRYNPQTCCYERSTTTFGQVSGYVAGVLFTALLIMAILLIGHDVLTDSEEEIALRKENAALGKYSVVLTGQLEEIESTLSALQQKDEALHNKLFTSSTGSYIPENNDSRQPILLGDASIFSKYL